MDSTSLRTVRAKGVTFHEFPAAEQAKWRKLNPDFFGDFIKEMTANAYEGGANVQLEFFAGVDTDKALQNVREKVDKAKAKIPSEAEEPTVTEVKMSRFDPMLVLNLAGEVSERTLTTIAKDLKEKLEGLNGVLEVNLVGVREELIARLRQTVNNIADSAGATAEITIGGSAPVTGNDPELLSRMMPTLQWAAGEENVVEHPLITGAEDFSMFQKKIPGLYLMLGVNDEGVAAGQSPSNHSPFVSPNEDAMITGVRALVGFAYDYAASADR